MARFLKSCGCNVNLQNTLYSTALHGACLAGQLNIVMFLVEIRADIEIEDHVKSFKSNLLTSLLLSILIYSMGKHPLNVLLNAETTK